MSQTTSPTLYIEAGVVAAAGVPFYTKLFLQDLSSLCSLTALIRWADRLTLVPTRMTGVLGQWWRIS